MFAAIRGRYLHGKITATRATEAAEALSELVITIVDTVPLLPRMWELRDRISAHDAAYVVVAQTHECPLVSADLKFLHAVSELAICDVTPV